MSSRPFFIALLPLLPLLVACSAAGDGANNGGTGGGGGSGGGGGAVTCPPDPNWNGASPPVSLKNDLLADSSSGKPGIFRRACAASACHDESRPEAALFIAPPLQDTMTQMPIAITPDHIMRLLGTTDGVLRMSQTVPTMPLVDPGKPATSFLMRKMDGCFTDIASQCTPVGDGTPPCGDEMPAGSDILDAAERDTVRRWIFQGATNN